MGIKRFFRKIRKFWTEYCKIPELVPKHKDSKQMCVNIAKKIIGNKDILNKLKTKKYIQMKQLSKIIDVHPKTVLRNRAYIICLCIILESDYKNFKEYLKQVF